MTVIGALKEITPYLRLDYLTLHWWNNGVYTECLSPDRDSQLGILSKVFLNNTPQVFRLKPNQYIVSFEDVPITTRNGNITIQNKKLDLELILGISKERKTNDITRKRITTW